MNATSKNDEVKDDVGLKSEFELLQDLREIILNDDRKDVEALRKIIDDPNELSKRMMPTIQKMLQNSQEEFLTALSPVLGKMVRKYVQHQIQLLKESVDGQLRKTFDVKGYWRWVKAKVLGVKDSDLIFHDINVATVEEIYVVQRDSGLLVGSFSKNEAQDRDMIAGMLTAIKAFAEDAFRRDKEELGSIMYENFQILTMNYKSFYIAVVVSGAISTAEKDVLYEKLYHFGNQELEFNFSTISSEIFEDLSEKLSYYYHEQINKD